MRRSAAPSFAFCAFLFSSAALHAAEPDSPGFIARARAEVRTCERYRKDLAGLTSSSVLNPTRARSLLRKLDEHPGTPCALVPVVQQMKLLLRNVGQLKLAPSEAKQLRNLSLNFIDERPGLSGRAVSLLVQLTTAPALLDSGLVGNSKSFFGRMKALYYQSRALRQKGRTAAE